MTTQKDAVKLAELPGAAAASEPPLRVLRIRAEVRAGEEALGRLLDRIAG